MSHWLAGLGNPAVARLRAADAVLDISGGDSFTDLYGPRRFHNVASSKRLALEAGKPLVLLPQTYGPYRDPRYRALRRTSCRRAALAWARDPRSFEVLQELAGPDFDPQRHRCGVDVAFALEARPPHRPLPEPIATWLGCGTGFQPVGSGPALHRPVDSPQPCSVGPPWPTLTDGHRPPCRPGEGKAPAEPLSYAAAPLAPSPLGPSVPSVIGFNVSGLIWHDPAGARTRYGFKADYRECVLGFLRRVLRGTDARIVLVPHVLTPPGHYESDPGANAAVQAALADELGAADRLAAVPPVYDPMETKWLIARCDWFCGTRMHACIAALSSGVPTAAIAYSVKTQGVFETCGQGGCVADPRAAGTADVVDRLWTAWQDRAAARTALAGPRRATARRAADGGDPGPRATPRGGGAGPGGAGLSLRGRVLKGAAVLSVGQGVGQALSFVRNIIVARLVSPDDFGIAATFAITVSLLEMLSDLAADKLLIQARDGDDENLQATAQLWQFTRGLGSAVLIALLAWPMSRLFKVPQAQWAFYWLALVPLLRGFVHLDLKRLQRGMKFTPQVLTEVGSQTLITAAAWPLAYWLRDYSAVLWLVIVQAAALAVLSHLTAQRPYRWAYDRVQMRRLLGFGWPLLINGLLMFGIFQGDRLVIGSMYSVHALAVYSVSFALATAPNMILGSIMASLSLPVLAQVQDTPGEFTQRYRLMVQTAGALAALVVVGLITPGAWLIPFVFGPAYIAAGPVFTWLVGAEALRLIRLAPTSAAVARADTQTCLRSNLVRVLAFPLAGACATVGLPLPWIAACAFFAEVLAFSAAIVRTQRRHGLQVRLSLAPCAFFLVALFAGRGLAAASVGAGTAVRCAATFGALMLCALGARGLAGHTTCVLRGPCCRAPEFAADESRASPRNLMTVSLRTIRDVAERQLCCGCGVCAYLSLSEIEMVDTLDYGRRPLVARHPPHDPRSAEALAACPGLRLEHSFDRHDPALIPELTAGWGSIREVWEGYAADPEIRFAGSSGGAASALALYAIERAGFAGVLHITARPDVPYLNHTVLSTTHAEILAATGSRYAPASPCDGLQMIEDAPGPCVFIGKPCDVAGAVMAAKLRPRLAEKLGLTIAIFCAGTPTTRATMGLLRQLGVDDPSRARAFATAATAGLDRSLCISRTPPAASRSAS